jgi:hypothetical protein
MSAGKIRQSADESESALETSVALEKLAERVYQIMRKELRLELARTQSSIREGNV